MKLLFTKSQSWFSGLICSTTEEEVSHVSVQINDKFVVHSNIRGLHIQYLPNFLAKQEKVVSLPIEELPEVYELLKQYEHKWYDVGAILFLGLSLWLRNKFKLPLPKSNLWQATGMFLCTEFISQLLYGEEMSMLTPEQLYAKVKASGENHEK